MLETPRSGHPDIRIRAIKAWTPEHGHEAPHLTFSAAEKTELGRLAEVIDYKTVGSQIFSQGLRADFLYLVGDGVVQASYALGNGDRQVLGFYWPGDLFGLAEGGVYVNSAEAVTSCSVYRFPFQRLTAFLIAHPEIQHSFLIKAIHDHRATQRQLIVMGRFDVHRRLAAFLLDCSGHAHYFDPTTRSLTIPMTRYDIADYLGTSPESVTRAFAALEAKALLHRVTARVIELDRAALKSFLGMDS